MLQARAPSALPMATSVPPVLSECLASAYCPLSPGLELIFLWGFPPGEADPIPRGDPKLVVLARVGSIRKLFLCADSLSGPRPDLLPASL